VPPVHERVPSEPGKRGVACCPCSIRSFECAHDGLQKLLYTSKREARQYSSNDAVVLFDQSK